MSVNRIAGGYKVVFYYDGRSDEWAEAMHASTVPVAVQLALNDPLGRRFEITENQTGRKLSGADILLAQIGLSVGLKPRHKAITCWAKEGF